MLYCVVLIVQFSSRNMSYCSGFHATACMDGWYPCSYCGYQTCATHLAWLCVDVWHMGPRTDSWERECVPPYELFSNLHVVWDDRYWPRPRAWVSKCPPARVLHGGKISALISVSVLTPNSRSNSKKLLRTKGLQAAMAVHGATLARVEKRVT